jgi:uncharacterized pyridoxal phosphate-containing UPF0001 family protein
MDDFTYIGGNVAAIRAEIESAARRSGRDSSMIDLMAVSKRHPAEAVHAAWKAGIRLFGENRVQEAHAKFAGIRGELDGLRLDMIGPLQTNKIGKAVALFNAIQSVDSEELLRGILDRIITRWQKCTQAGNAVKSCDTESMYGPMPALSKLYFELHTGEDSKTGFPDADSIFRACEHLIVRREALTQARSQTGARAFNLELAGLMTMAPFTSDETMIRRSFSSLRHTLEDVQKKFGLEDTVGLSMGMSGDYRIAVEEGATLIRIGTAIFGERNP